jgi:hypothetical protein
MENDININIEPVITVKSLLVDSINKKYFDYIKKTIDNNVSVSNLLYTQVCSSPLRGFIMYPHNEAK